MKIVFLDNIRSMQNVWSIFRNADASGFEKIILSWYTPTPPRSFISKTAIWAQNWIDWEYYKDWIPIIKELKKNWYEIISLEITKDSIDYKSLFLEKYEKVVLILWNEISGVNTKFLTISDKKVSINMKWKKESINVSVASWIAMYAISETQKI